MNDFSTAPLLLHSVVDRGQPNRERIALFAREDINTTSYGLLIGVSIDENDAIPIPDNYFWLGNGLLRKGDWLLVYTGPGTSRIDSGEGGTSIYSVFWNRDKTVFYDPKIVPVLLKTQDVWVLPPPHPPAPLPQYDLQKLANSVRK